MFHQTENPFVQPFKLNLIVSVGEYFTHYFEGQTLHEKDAEDWNCSLLIVDYIRIYQNVSRLHYYNTTGAESINSIQLLEQNKLTDQQNLSKVTSSQICNKLMPLINPRPNWKLIFSDEFNGIEFNEENKWDVENELIYCDGKLAQLFLIKY